MKNKTDTSKLIYHDFCGNTSLISLEDTCPDTFNRAKLNEFYDKNCAGKTDCDINLAQYIKNDKSLKV